MPELVRAQSAVVLRPSYTTTIYRTKSVPDISFASRYVPRWPYRYYKDYDLYDDYWYDRYYHYSPLYQSVFYPRRYYHIDYTLNPYSHYYHPFTYSSRYGSYLRDYVPSYYRSSYDSYYLPRYRYSYSSYYPLSYYSSYLPSERYWLTSSYLDRFNRYRYY